MILEHIRLYNFRCYEEAELRPDERFNVIVGLNGQGKTSILEAIGLAAFLRSFRNGKNAEMLRLGQTEGLVSAAIRNRGLTAQLAVKLWPNRKQATFNGKSCRYLSEYIGRISAVSFSPTDLEIVRGSPENRRLWIDKVTQIHEPSHADTVARYQKILEQRNRLLRQVAEGRLKGPPPDLATWTDELVSWGARIIHSRIHTVDKTVDIVSRYYRQISQENAGINIRYESEIFGEVHYGQASSHSLELITQFLKNGLDAALPKELILGTTLVGPHRDDLELTLDGLLVKSFGSQGEVRSLVLAMRLAEVEVYKSVQRLDPIVLIDDFSSELDARRRKFLLEYLTVSGSQVFLSTTEEIRLGKVFEVRDGKIFPLESPSGRPWESDEHGHAPDRCQ